MPLYGAAYQISVKLLCLYLVQHMLHQIKAQQLFTDLSCTENSKKSRTFQGFKSNFPVLFQGRFKFQGLFKKILYIKVLSKPV